MSDWSEAEERAREILRARASRENYSTMTETALARDFLALKEENERLRAMGFHSDMTPEGYKALEARIEAALALHTVNEFGWCRECWDRNNVRDKGPCPTVKALKGGA